MLYFIYANHRLKRCYMIQKLNFTDFSSVVEKKFNKISSDENNILVQMRTNKDTLWNLYLNSFPSEANPIFRERTEYECNVWH